MGKAQKKRPSIEGRFFCALPSGRCLLISQQPGLSYSLSDARLMSTTATAANAAMPSTI
jgi:hypothetical protein